MKRVHCVVLCILSLTLVSCTFESKNLIEHYNSIYSDSYSVDAYNTAFRAETTNKKTLNSASYVREVDKDGNIHISISNNKVGGDAYYIAENKTAYLKTGNTFVKAKDIDPMLLYSIPVVGNITLDSLGFKNSDTAEMHLDKYNYVYTIHSDELNEATLIVNGKTDTIEDIRLNNDNELFVIHMYEPDRIHIQDSDDDEIIITDVTSDEFIADLQHLKLNGYFADGVLTMNNVNTFSISADMVNNK